MTAVLLAAALAVHQPELRDADAVVRLLASLRTADPAVCVLAGRALTNVGGWNWGEDDPMPAPMPMPVPMPMPFGGGGMSVAGPNIGHRSWRNLDATVLAAFRTALRDESHCVRRIAARVVAQAEPAWAAAEFGALAKDAAAGFREIGLLGLGELEDPKSLGVISRPWVIATPPCGRWRPGPWASSR